MNPRLKIIICMQALFYLIAIVTCASFSFQAVAATNQFIQIEGDNGIVPGDSTDDAHKNWSDIVGYGQTLTTPTTKTPVCQSTITKSIDSASPFLWTLAVGKKLLKKATVEAVAAGESRHVVFRATMQNIKVNEVISQEDNASGNSSNMEKIILLPQTINFEVFPQNPDGSVGTPITANIACVN